MSAAGTHPIRQSPPVNSLSSLPPGSSVSRTDFRIENASGYRIAAEEPESGLAREAKALAPFSFRHAATPLMDVPVNCSPHASPDITAPCPGCRAVVFSLLRWTGIVRVALVRSKGA